MAIATVWFFQGGKAAQDRRFYAEEECIFTKTLQNSDK